MYVWACVCLCLCALKRSVLSVFVCENEQLWARMVVSLCGEAVEKHLK